MIKNINCGGVSKSHICPQCGMHFLVPYQSKGGGKTQWAYRRRKSRKTLYYCSYHCFKDSEGGVGI